MERKTKHLTLLSDGVSLLFDFSKCDNYTEAILADYVYCPSDDQLKESISLCFPDNASHQEISFKELKSKFSKVIPGRRKVYYVAVYNEIHERIAVVTSTFLGRTGLFYANLRFDADLFGDRDEAEELIRKIESNGICNKQRYLAMKKESPDVQYKIIEWKF